MGWEKSIKYLWIIMTLNTVFGVIGILMDNEMSSGAVGNLVICSIIISTKIICRKIDSLEEGITANRGS